ncbi:pseudouridine synthase [Abyssicoccus albus]|uniref:pseudouridine synthase n=1 Tax=Abyssicoccus albus TaxID=1817405 RepID=UPI00097E31D4|nr:pseudouridine synthase [Abyssicoccus albus]AQL56515.1 hypothetical protein BVH56_06070 [Abyssicoccus albus]
MRLDKYLVHCGVGSRKEVQSIIKKGRIEVNDNQLKKPNVHVSNDDVITLDGERIDYIDYVYLMLNKPAGVVTAVEDAMHETVMKFVPERYRHRSIVPVGRLDKDTTGLLLLTDDGQFNHLLMSPKHHVKKVYEVTLVESVSDMDIEQIESGIVLKDGTHCQPAAIKIMDEDTKVVHIELTEGKYHQVKRMFAAVGNRVVQLKRIQLGSYILEEKLTEGSIIEISKEDIQ